MLIKLVFAENKNEYCRFYCRAIVRRCLRDVTFNRFDRTSACDGRTNRRTQHHSIYTTEHVVKSRLINATGSQKVSCFAFLIFDVLPSAFATIDHNILITRLSSWFGSHGSVFCWFNHTYHLAHIVLNVITTSLPRILPSVAFPKALFSALNFLSRIKLPLSFVNFAVSGLTSTRQLSVPLLPLWFTPNLITVILSNINSLSLNYPVSSSSRTLLLVYTIVKNLKI